MSLKRSAPAFYCFQQSLHIEGVVEGFWAREVSRAAGEQRGGSHLVLARMVDEGDRDLSQTLQELLFMRRGGPPNVLEHLVRFEKLAAVKKLNSAKVELRVHVSF